VLDVFAERGSTLAGNSIQGVRPSDYRPALHRRLAIWIEDYSRNWNVLAARRARVIQDSRGEDTLGQVILIEFLGANQIPGLACGKGRGVVGLFDGKSSWGVPKPLRRLMRGVRFLRLSGGCGRNAYASECGDEHTTQ
jgi:hypothetical protein